MSFSECHPQKAHFRATLSNLFLKTIDSWPLILIHLIRLSGDIKKLKFMTSFSGDSDSHKSLMYNNSLPNYSGNTLRIRTVAFVVVVVFLVPSTVSRTK